MNVRVSQKIFLKKFIVLKCSRPKTLLRSVLLVLSLTLPAAPYARALSKFPAQARASSQPRENKKDNHAASSASLERITLAMNMLCLEQAQDALRSVPIDEMQAQEALPLLHPEALAGRGRAERLLPTVKRLTATVVKNLMKEHGVGAIGGGEWLKRLNSVRRIKPKVELRDNAQVYVDNPNTIHFGTIFLAGLPSDEAMASVLAHELTHIADGREGRLRPLFHEIRKIAAKRTRLRISTRQAEELTCDLVGLTVARRLIEKTPNAEPLSRRIARAVEHNCVVSDRTDRAHLSPRKTLLALMALDEALVDEMLSAS